MTSGPQTDLAMGYLPCPDSGFVTHSIRWAGLMVPVKAIRLSQGRSVIVDPEDYPALVGYWLQVNARPSGKVYIRAKMWDQQGQWRQMHTLITGWPMVQHINGNAFDCRRCNLRELNRTTLQASRRKVPERKGTPTTSRFKGVIRDSRVGLWLAQLKGSPGHYANETDAAEAYDARAVELFGEYAVTNQTLGLYPIAEHHPSATAGGGTTWATPN